MILPKSFTRSTWRVEGGASPVPHVPRPATPIACRASLFNLTPGLRAWGLFPTHGGE